MIAFVPIKHNSERVPGKNFRLLGGIPLYLWIITNLYACNFLEKIVVDTDSTDEKLWSLHGLGNIVVKKRSESLVGDFVSMNAIIWDYVQDYDSETFLMTHVTNPFISLETLEKAALAFNENQRQGYDSLFSVNRVQSRLYSEDCKPMNHNPDKLERTQDLNPIFEENSCLYIFSAQSFRDSKGRIGRNASFYETPFIESLDIDTQDEWEMASILSSKFFEKLHPKLLQELRMIVE